MNKLVLVDGHHLMYRAYWAIPRTLKSSKGEQTNAVFGFASMLLNILAQEEPNSLLICFDAGEETFRHQENETYKDGRAETPDDFYVQIPRMIQVAEVLGLKHVADAKYEADDFLCLYAREAEKQGDSVVIVTGDKDALQIATDKITIAIPHKGYQQTEYLGPKEIESKYGIRPDQVAAYKGLCGDSSDNLAGVMGIGPKTAAKLLQDYDTLEGIYEHLPAIKESTRTKLENDRDQAFFCQRMATLVDNIALPIPLDELLIQTNEVEPILDFFNELEFTLLIRRLQRLQQSTFGQRVFKGDVTETDLVDKPEDQLALF